MLQCTCLMTNLSGIDWWNLPIATRFQQLLCAYTFMFHNNVERQAIPMLRVSNARAG